MRAPLQYKPPPAAPRHDPRVRGVDPDHRVVQRAAVPRERAQSSAIAAPRQTVADYAASHALGVERTAARPNRTGLPDRLKSGMESLSGIALDDVRVHRNSPRPAQLQALAHTQGSEIHLGPGQERHLPHEAWHVVQQKQGRVHPTMQLRGTAINDDAGLEREADMMGTRAAGHAGPAPAVVREAATQGTVPVAQCAGHVRFANLHPDYQEKGQAIIDGLLHTPRIAAYLGTRDALITRLGQGGWRPGADKALTLVLRAGESRPHPRHARA
jgi:Domain of unknown function (DUF4157)